MDLGSDWYRRAGDGAPFQNAAPIVLCKRMQSSRGVAWPGGSLRGGGGRASGLLIGRGVTKGCEARGRCGKMRGEHGGKQQSAAKSMKSEKNASSLSAYSLAAVTKKDETKHNFCYCAETFCR